MSIERGNSGEHAAFWRRVLNKPEPAAAERTLTQAERIAAWSARNRQDEGKSTQTRVAVEPSRRDVANPGATTVRTRVLSTEEVRHVGRPGTSYAIGDTHPAMDGTRWKRVA
ncbi:hypothetical protein [Methylobacterium sp. J-076]|uniref:hypothetical protein n=1 Tax=Methylobacterium sp. J-076 TaxID=2836655 RepID=UPI001FB8C3CD|nr:hypothetical protein [Methylobacterium sp. J-076]MCJ2011539.1 hypothetical protein [Methylobacterium sp. J-076]